MQFHTFDTQKFDSHMAKPADESERFIALFHKLVLLIPSLVNYLKPQGPYLRGNFTWVTT